MKTLKNHTILFDAECPMCRAISRGLVGSGLTTEEGTVPYQEFPEMICPLLDRQRAADEIALINDETGEVSYGVESLFKLLASSYPALRLLLSFGPFIWLMSELYKFIAANRRVIVPSSNKGNNSAIQPTFRLGYRLAYLAITWLIAALIFSSYMRYNVYLILVAQLILPGAVVYVVAKSKVWDYLGNLMTITAGGSLLLLPALLLANWIGQSPLIYQPWLAVVLLLMLWEHIRRCKILELGAAPNVAWALYSSLALYLLFWPA